MDVLHIGCIVEESNFTQPISFPSLSPSLHFSPSPTLNLTMVLKCRFLPYFLSQNCIFFGNISYHLLYLFYFYLILYFFLFKSKSLPRPELHQMRQWLLDFYRQMTNSKVHQQPLACINIKELKQSYCNNMFQGTRTQVKDKKHQRYINSPTSLNCCIKLYKWFMKPICTSNGHFLQSYCGSAHCL